MLNNNPLLQILQQIELILLENILKAKTGLSRMTEVLYFTQAQRHSSNVYVACLQRKPIRYSVYTKKEKNHTFFATLSAATLANLAAISAENRVAIYSPNLFLLHSLIN